MTVGIASTTFTIVYALARLLNGTTSLAHTYDWLFFKFEKPMMKKQTVRTMKLDTKSMIVCAIRLTIIPPITDFLRPTRSGITAKSPPMTVPMKN